VFIEELVGVPSTLEVSSWDLNGSEIQGFLMRAKDKLPFLYQDGCWRVTRTKLAIDFDTLKIYRKFVLSSVPDRDCQA
jgi:hypothetical protein